MTIEELYSILLSDKPSVSLKNREKDLFSLIPSLEVCKGFNQNSEWHIYDVYEHILHVVDNVSPNIVMRLAALFHDVGKPLTYTEDENKVGHFYNHWVVSRRIFLEFANQYQLDQSMIDRISNLIYYHDINIALLGDDKIKELVSRLGLDGVKALFEFKKADLLAQNEKFHYILDDYDKEKEKVFSKFKEVE